MNLNTTFRGREIHDVRGEPIGSVTDTIFDVEEHPRWLVVKPPGFLKPERILPAIDLVDDRTGGLRASVTRDQVMESPKAPRDHVVGPVLQGQLESHYAVGP
jgi:sporulation protein YlmC with PRC-barrel domain